MIYLTFELHGEYALWRHLGDALGAYSTPGPAPSHIAGIVGAAMGMPNQASQRKSDNIAWNTSEELLTWERESEFRVGCRLLRSAVRVPYRVNGIKGVDEWVTLRMNQFPVERPRYQVIIGLNSLDCAKDLLQHLQKPVFRIFLGITQFSGFIKGPLIIEESAIEKYGWAYWSEKCIEDYTFCTLHDTRKEKRIVLNGYWIYPDPEDQRVNVSPLIKGYN